MMTRVVLPFSSKLYDKLESYWSHHNAHKVISRLLVGAFFLGLILAEFTRLGIFPLQDKIQNHFFAVEISFTLLLLIEILSLLFVMPHSVGNSVGKQLEILSLILIRSAFKEFSNFEEPVIWNAIDGPVLKMGADAFGALIIFFMISIYYKTKKRIRLTESEEEHLQFHDFKKLVSLMLLAVFIVIGLFDIYHLFHDGTYFKSLNTFYTVLIFSDILILLIVMRYTLEYSKIFRYSAFVLTTVLIRISLTAPPYLNAIIGILASLFLLLMTLAFNYYVKKIESGQQ